jgi:hypothetical protein
VKLLTTKGASWIAIVLAIVTFLADVQAHDLIAPLFGDEKASTIVNVAKLLAAVLGAVGASVVSKPTDAAGQ